MVMAGLFTYWVGYKTNVYYFGFGAAQMLACARDLDLDLDRVNVNGGAIALGHPIGATGARIVVTLLHELARRGGENALATLCISGGMGIATAFHRNGH